SCFGGSAFDQTCPTYVTATGTSAWTYNLPAAALTDGHTYSVTVETVDAIGNTDPSAATQSFTWDTTPPTISSASVAADGVTVTATWSENLDQSQAVPGSALSVTPNGGSAVAGTASAVTYPAANQTRFTLSAPIHQLDNLTLAYTKPGSGAVIRDTAATTGNAATSASGVSVANNAADDAPTSAALVSPAGGAQLATTTPTLTATFADPDANDTGLVRFELCSDSGCGTVLGGAFDSSTVANGANGSASVPAGRIAADGTYYWRAESVDASAQVSGYGSTRSFTVDTTAPAMSSATIGADGTTVTITWSENLDQSQPVAGSAFDVKANGGAPIAGTGTVTYPAPNELRFSLASPVAYLDSLVLDYSAPAGAKVRDAAQPTGNAAVSGSLGNGSIANGTADASPSVPALGAPADGARLDTATPQLSATFADPDANDTGSVTFELCSDASCATSLGTFSSGSVANGAAASATVPNGLVTADGTYYWRAQDVDSSSRPSSFGATRSFVVDTTAPTITSAVVGADGTSVTLTWSESLDQSQSVAASDLSINGIAGSGQIAYTNATTTTFSLSSPVHRLDTLTLAYAKPGSDPMIRDLAQPTGNAAASASGISVTNNAGDLAPTTPALVTPNAGDRVNTATPLLTATFADPDANDTGKITFEVCAASACSSPLATFDSTSTSIANGSNGSAAIPAGAITADGTYYWRAQNVDSASTAS